jgi:hypothetical protein
MAQEVTRVYYGSEVTYSLNKKKNVPFEFPQRNIVFETAYDVMSPSDKFLIHNKDNAFHVNTCAEGGTDVFL